MLADLYVAPKPEDVSLLCTNLRTTDGKRPRSVVREDAVFIIPLSTMRFVEVPSQSFAAANRNVPAGGGAAAGNGHGSAEDSAEGALVSVPGNELYSVLPDPEQVLELDAGAHDDGPEADEELLRRIRAL